MAGDDLKITANPAASVNPTVVDGGNCQSVPDVFQPGLINQTTMPTVANVGDTYTEPNLVLNAVLKGRSLPPTLADFNIPYPTLTVDERLAFFNQIPEINLTAHTRGLIRAGEIREYFRNLTPEDFATRSEKIFAQAQELANITHEVINLRISDGFDPFFAVSRLRNEVWHGDGKAVVLVFDLHMRKINVLDESKALGTWVIDQNREFFQDEIKHSKAVYDNLRVLPTAVQMRNRTAFVVVSTNSREGEVFKQITLEQLSRYPDYMAEKLTLAQAEGLVPADIDTASVEFGATGYFTTVDLKDGIPKRLRGMELDHFLIDKLQPVVSTTAWLKTAEVNDPAAVLLRAAGVTVFGDRALEGLDPIAASALHLDIENERAFVKFGVYIPYLTTDGRMGPIEKKHLAKYITPDLSMQRGELTRRPSLNGGGDLEHFMGVVTTLTEHPELAQRPALMALLRAETDNLVGKVIHMGAEARADAQLMVAMNPLTVWHGKPADFLVEQASGINVTLPEGYKAYRFDMEGNWAGRFAAQYPAKGKLADENFQAINWQPYRAAHEMGLPPPVTAKEGDQLRGIVFAPDARTAQRFGELTMFLVHRTHADKPILLPDGTTVPLTVSISLTEAPDFSTPEGIREFNWVGRRSALYAEYLKAKNLAETGSKEGIGWMPPDFAVELAKMEMLDPETMKELSGQETIPIIKIDLGPMTNPIDESFNKAMIEMFLPTSIPGSTEIITTGDGLVIGPSFGDPLPPPPPMITPIETGHAPIFARFIEAEQCLVKGFVSDLVVAGAVQTIPSVALPSMNFATPKLGMAGGSANAIGAALTFVHAGINEYADNPPPWHYDGGDKVLYFFKMGNKGMERMMDDMVRTSRYFDCRSNPDRRCIREFGAGIGWL